MEPTKPSKGLMLLLESRHPKVYDGRQKPKAVTQIWNIKGCLVPKAILNLRAKSDRSNLPRCSTSPRLGIHSESHGSESCPPLARQGTPARAPAFFSISAIGPKAGRRRLACSTDIQTSLFDSRNYAWRRGKDAVCRAASRGSVCQE